MKLIFKRIGAYIIDVILVTLIATLITSNSYINKDYKNYETTYKEYSKEYEEYKKYLDELEKVYDDKKISDEEYNNLIELDTEDNNYLGEKYSDKNIDEKEYEVILENINKDYSITEQNYSYKLLKYSRIQNIITIMCILLYFVVFQFYFDGKTLGKKVMKLKVVSNNNKQLTILNYFIRSLVVNEVFINVLNILFLSILSKSSFFKYSEIAYVITYILEMAIIFTIVFNKDNRGLHDYISNTKVIEDKKE